MKIAPTTQPPRRRIVVISLPHEKTANGTSGTEEKGESIAEKAASKKKMRP